MGQAIAGKEIGENLTYAFADCNGESNLYLVGIFSSHFSPSFLFVWIHHNAEIGHYLACMIYYI